MSGAAKGRIRHHPLVGGQHNIAGALELFFKKAVRSHRPIGRVNGRMIRACFTEHDIQPDGFGTLGVQFAHQTPVNVARPVKAELEIRSQPAFAEDRHRIVPDINKSQLVGNRWVHLVGHAQPPVIGDPFQPLEKLEARHPLRQHFEQADQAQAAHEDKQGCQLNGPNFHAAQINKKTRATQGCSPPGKRMTDRKFPSGIVRPAFAACHADRFPV